MTRELAARAAKLLRVNEWTGECDRGYTACWQCGAWAFTTPRPVHNPGCELAAVLAELEAVEPLALDALAKAPKP